MSVALPFYDKLMPLLGFDLENRTNAVVQSHEFHVVEYVHPDRFKEYERIGEEMGFLFVASGPFVRSSYNAQAFSEKLLADRLARVGVA